MKVLFLNESGEHSFVSIDRTYPVIVLAGVIVDAAYHKNEIRPTFETFKRDKIGDSSVCLRTAEMKANRQGFEFLRDRTARERFREDLNELMGSLDYK